MVEQLAFVITATLPILLGAHVRIQTGACSFIEGVIRRVGRKNYLVQVLRELENGAVQEILEPVQRIPANMPVQYCSWLLLHDYLPDFEFGGLPKQWLTVRDVCAGIDARLRAGELIEGYGKLGGEYTWPAAQPKRDPEAPFTDFPEFEVSVRSGGSGQFVVQVRMFLQGDSSVIYELTACEDDAFRLCRLITGLLDC